MREQDIRAPQTQAGPERRRVTLKGLEQRLTKLETAISELTQLFKEKISRDEAKGELIKTVITQLQKYERDFVFEKFQKRTFLDVIQLFDRIDAIKQNISTELENFGGHLESVQTEILQLLKRQGVELIEEAPKRFNEEFQEAMAQEFTSNPEEDKFVISVEKRGFTYEGRLLRPEMVVAAKYRKEGGEDG